MVANYTKLYEKEKIFGKFLQPTDSTYDVCEIGTQSNSDE